MPQNWWELFPEVVPSPAARPRPLPGQDGAMPGPAMGLRAAAPYDAFGPDRGPPGAFDPPYFSGGGPFDGSPGQVMQPGFGQQPFAGDNGAPAMDRSAAIQHAAAALQRGADPEAGRARLNQMGHAEPDPPSPFSDLIPDGGQVFGMTGASGMPMPAERPSSQEGGLDESSYPAANPQQYRGNLQRRSDPMMAPQKADGPRKYLQRTGGAQPTGFGSNIGRVIPDLVNRQARSTVPSATASLTPWQTRRRNENAALLANPRIRAFLDMISFSEGNTTYDRLFGNDLRTFTDRSTHPGNHGQLFHGIPGGAAGRYQIMARTYRDLNRLLGPYTMSDRDQDLMAVELIREGPALELLLSGHLDQAISRLGQRKAWTSFPVLENGAWRQNPSHQPTRDIGDLRARFQAALNRYSRPGLGLAATAASLGQ
jgi:muramidase (phage lysozyme)